MRNTCGASAYTLVIPILYECKQRKPFFDAKRRTSTCSFTTRTLQLSFDSALSFTNATGFIACKYFSMHDFIDWYRLFAGFTSFFICSKCTSSPFARFKAIHISGKYFPTYSLSVWVIWVAGILSVDSDLIWVAWKLVEENELIKLNDFVCFELFSTTWTSKIVPTTANSNLWLSIFDWKNILIDFELQHLLWLCATYWNGPTKFSSRRRAKCASHLTSTGCIRRARHPEQLNDRIMDILSD